MPADPQTAKVDERRISRWTCDCGHVAPGRAAAFHYRRDGSGGWAPCRAVGSPVTYVPASVVDALREERDALRKLGRRVAEELDGHVGTLINYPSVQPLTGWLNRQADELADLARLIRDGGPLPDDEYDELTRERDALRAEVEQYRLLYEGRTREVDSVIAANAARVRELEAERDRAWQTYAPEEWARFAGEKCDALCAEGARQERERMVHALMEDGRVAAVLKARAMLNGAPGPLEPVALADELIRAALAAVLSEEGSDGS